MASAREEAFTPGVKKALRKDCKLSALALLAHVYRHAEMLADGLDPERKRNYERDHVLKALDGMRAAAKTGLDIELALRKRRQEAVRTAWKTRRARKVRL